MSYIMPAENKKHEGTWLTWPHSYTYGKKYQKEIEPIWIQMTQALHKGEIVHIIVYNKSEKQRVETLLLNHEVDITRIELLIVKSDDVWIRDTGPLFLIDENKELRIANFKFDGWGKKAKFKKDDAIPNTIGTQKNIVTINIPNFVLEGGSVELDGNGTLMATISSVVSKNRNQQISMIQAENYLTQYFGVDHFIWLKGVVDEDITDAHIDGMARFFDDTMIITVSRNDFKELYENIDMKDYDTLLNAKNKEGKHYKIMELPLTKKNVKGLAYKGSYLNYYIANEVILVAIYNDENDETAIKKIAQLYPDKSVVAIDVTMLFQYGGMLHCITQQQPISKL